MKQAVARDPHDAAGDVWSSDTPFTDRISFLPEPVYYGEVSTVAAFDAWDGRSPHVITWSDWMTVFDTVAGRYFTANVTVLPRGELHPLLRERPVWSRVKTSGEYALEISQAWRADTLGARLVHCDDGSVLQYQPEMSSRVTVSIGDASTLSFAIWTDEPFEDGAFAMTVESDDLAAMDEYERKIEARYRAAGERDARALHFDRD
jgi:hypothetical protein